MLASICHGPSMIQKLTKRTVEAISAGEKDALVWDTDLKGFGVKVTPAGRRVFIVQYWSPTAHRVRRRLTLGAFGTLTVEQARSEARRQLGRVAQGEDPGKEGSLAKRERRDETVQRVSALYLEESKAKLKPGSYAEYDRAFRLGVVPAMGKLPVKTVTSREVATLHLSLKSTPYQANRVVQYLRAFFNWCEVRGFRPAHTNPCRGIQRFRESSRERFLSAEEMEKLGAALVVAETCGLPPAPMHRKTPASAATAKHRPKNAHVPIRANPFAVGAIRFLALSGWREGEALTLEWDHLDLARGVATLPDTKAGKSFRHLGRAALEVLEKLPRISASRWVFPGARPDAPLREIQRTWCSVRHRAGLNDVRLHDLRHTVASYSVGGGYSLFVTGKLLGHKRADTTNRYAHLADDIRKEAADDVSDRIANDLAGRRTKVRTLLTSRG